LGVFAFVVGMLALSPQAELETTVYLVREGYSLRGELRSDRGPL
jgi:hypothetical protein